MSGELSHINHPELPERSNQPYRTARRNRAQNKALAQIDDNAERAILADYHDALRRQARIATEAILDKARSDADMEVVDHMKGNVVDSLKYTDLLVEMSGDANLELHLRSLDMALIAGYQQRTIRRGRTG